MKSHAVVWIETNGEFKVLSFTYEADADEFQEALEERGLPSLLINRRDVLNGGRG
jgi:hypothetical protein